MSELTYIDLCTECGGIAQGFGRAGIRCVGRLYTMATSDSEIFEDRVYRKAFGHTPIVDIEDPLPDADIWALPLRIRDIERMMEIRRHDGYYGEKIPKQLDAALGQILEKETVKARPRYIIFEGPANIVAAREGWHFANLLYWLDRARYDAEWAVLDFRQFGLPYAKKRCFVVAHARDGGTPRSAFLEEGLLGAVYGQDLKKIADNKVQWRCVYYPYSARPLNVDDRWKTGFYLVEAGDERLHPERQVFEENGKRYWARRLTPTELFRIQGFGEEFIQAAKSECTASRLYELAEGAICPTIIEAIGRRIKETIESPKGYQRRASITNPAALPLGKGGVPDYGVFEKAFKNRKEKIEKIEKIEE